MPTPAPRIPCPAWAMGSSDGTFAQPGSRATRLTATPKRRLRFGGTWCSGPSALDRLMALRCLGGGSDVPRAAAAFLDERSQHPFQPVEALRHLVSFVRRLPRAGGERRVVLPPVDPHVSRLVDRRDQQADLDLEELDLAETQRDVS